MINGPLLHLAVNHIPVLGIPFAFLLLAAAWMFRSRDLMLAGFATLILIGLSVYPIQRTGGMATHVVHDLPGVDHPYIHKHAHAAETATWATLGLGIFGLIGFWATKRSNGISRLWLVLGLIGSLGVSIEMGYVAHLGGLIRHPELAKDFDPNASAIPDDLLGNTSNLDLN